MFEKLRGFFKKMFDRITITRVLSEAPEITTAMIDKISEWENMWSGNAPWCAGSDYVTSLGIEKGICREFADVVLSELEVNVTNDNLLELYNAGTRDLLQNMQLGLAVGAFCIKPLSNTGLTEFVPADRFVPIRFDANAKPIDIAFIDTRHIDDDKYYIRLERHKLVAGALEITNTAYESSTRFGFDRVIPLSVLPDWENLTPGIRYPGMTEMDFGYYKNPIQNDIDGSPCGVSIYESAIDMIRKADIQGARLDWEFESAERAIHADDRMLRTQGKGHYSMPKLNKRLYRGLRTGSEDGDFFKEYSPDIRDTNFINGLERYLRQIEFSVGLSYGDLSDANMVEKTATEIKAARFRKYNRVAGIEDRLKDCLTDYVNALAFYNGLYHSGYDLTISFGDNVLTDEETERGQDRADLAAGIMQPYEYRMKWYNEDEATAKKMVNTPDDDVIED